VGTSLGCSVGNSVARASVGTAVEGSDDGGSLGASLGLPLGDSVAPIDGWDVGSSDGASVIGWSVGDPVAVASVGAAVEGSEDGGSLGASLDFLLGDSVVPVGGAVVAAKKIVGVSVGVSVGESLGASVGSLLGALLVITGAGQFLYPLENISVGSLLQPPAEEQQQGRNSSGTSSRHGSQQALNLLLPEDPALFPLLGHFPEASIEGSKPSQHPQKSRLLAAWPATWYDAEIGVAGTQASVFPMYPPPSK